ncbi:MAG: aminomethyl-transferring glycine dehydrogenase subunit GcvPA [Candidatus Omnitrophota bacterium]
MPYILNTPWQINEMLADIGLPDIDALYDSLPPKIKTKHIDIAAGLSEMELKKVLSRLSSRNKTAGSFNSFLGAGVYDHYIPSAVKHLAYRSEFYTAYTPYQPECSQGILQAIYEYQTFICRLTGMDVTNASLYDGATSLAEAILMSLRITGRNRILISRTVHPECRKTSLTYLGNSNYEVKELTFDRCGVTDLDLIKEELKKKPACIAIQSPNFFGLIEDIEEIAVFARKEGVLLLHHTNPVSLAILKEPLKMGVDIVSGDGQPLGGEMNFGGPTFGFLAAKNAYLRQLPGRVVGKTKDRDNRTAFCLTLQTREQHIRRQKATSNICSNQSLNAIAAAIYLSLLGKDGFINVASYSLNAAHYLYDQLKEINKIILPFSGPFINEFVWQVPDAARMLRNLKKKGILGGFRMGTFYREFKNCILTACTEKKTKEDIEQFVRAIKESIGG